MDDIALAEASGIMAASTRIDRVFLNSPLMDQPTANAALGCRLLAKLETLNPIRSFKGRGTAWWMANLPASDLPIVTASAGNFGQGLAYAAAARGRRLIVFAASTANPRKLDAMARLGAEVELEGDDFDAAKGKARSFASTHGFLFVEDGAEKHIAEGAGTIAMELTAACSDTDRIDTLLVPLGNGALLTGMGAWMRFASPRSRVVGVVAATAPCMKLSWEQSRVVSTRSALTIADGIAVRDPVPYALRSMRETVDDVVAVEEDVIVEATRFCLDHYGVVVEPAGAVGVAAILADAPRWRDQTIATVLCGGNVAGKG